MRKIVIYVVVGSDAGEAPGGVEGDKSRESAGRKHARQNPLVAMQRESLCSHWHSRRKRHRSRKLLLAVGRDAGAEVSMDRPVHGRTWTDMDMDGRTDVHGLL